MKEEFNTDESDCKLTAPGQVDVQKQPETDLSSREGSKDDAYNLQKSESDSNKSTDDKNIKESILKENATPFDETEPIEPTSAIDKFISRLKLERPEWIDGHPIEPSTLQPSISGSDTENSVKLYGTDEEEDSVDVFDPDFYMKNVV